ncbi:MAG: GAF domain-containing protein [Roseiflexaceae bacterium]|nr:GAF domain-containing protein [Roseiflexaceae bacterium]
MAVTDTRQRVPPTDALIRITQAIETAATLDELLLLALNELTQLFDLARGAVLLRNDDGTGQIICEFPPHTSIPAPITIDATPLGTALHSRQPLEFEDGNLAELDSALNSYLQQRGVGASLVVPLIAQDTSIGLLLLSAAEPSRHFRADEISFARLLASQLAAAIVAFRITEQARRRGDELATLNEIAATVTSTLDTHEVYSLVVQKLNEYFNVDAGSLLLINEASGTLDFVMTIEGGEERLAGLRVPLGSGIVGHVAATGQYAVVTDVKNDPRFYREISDAVGYDTRSILCVPMLAKGRVIGAIELLNKLNGDFTERDARRLIRMAAFIGVAIENARLFKQVTDGRDRLQAILNSTADGILLTDMSGRLLSANPTAAQLFEAVEDELLGQSLAEQQHKLRARAHEVASRTWDGQDGEASRTVTEYELGGTRRRFMRHFTLPVRHDDGSVYAQLELFRDITQEKELEQLRDDYTGMLVHDLRAPLTSIMNGVMMVNRGLGGPVTEQQRELLNIAHQGSQTVLDLINNLLDIAKMEQGRMGLELEPVSPYALIDRATERLMVSARSRAIVVEQRLALGLPTIEADPDKVVRMLQNLLDNALKFSPANATVTIGVNAVQHGQPDSGLPLRTTLPSGDWLVFWIRDHGPGIPAAYHERIFEKFGQVRGRRARGTGLGLTFCKLAAEAHQGRIWLESREGHGSTFAFALPISTVT